MFINTYEDHRMAMAFAPLALMIPEVEIEDAEVVEKSYPAFWKDLEKVGFEVDVKAKVKLKAVIAEARSNLHSKGFTHSSRGCFVPRNDIIYN